MSRSIVMVTLSICGLIATGLNGLTACGQTISDTYPAVAQQGNQQFVGDAGFSKPQSVIAPIQTQSYQPAVTPAVSSASLVRGVAQPSAPISHGVATGPCGGCNQCRGFSGYGFGESVGFRNDACQYFRNYSQRPFGTFTKRTLAAQVCNGFAAQRVFFRFHFHFDHASQSWHLTEAGHRQADKVSQIIQTNFGSVIIETTGDMNADEARRQVALLELQQRGVQVASNDLVVGRSYANGISGIEAISIYDLRSRPVSLSQGASLSSGTFLPSALNTPSGSGSGAGGN